MSERDDAANFVDRAPILNRLCWIAAVVLATTQAWLHRHSINTDGISYADVSHAFTIGDWGLAVNAYWSPLYPWLLGSVVAIVKPSIWQELPTYHLVNLLIFFVALVSFQSFLSQLIRTWRHSQNSRPDSAGVAIPTSYLIVLGHLLFLYGTLDLISLKIMSPDLGVACVVFLAARQLLRISDEPEQWRAYVLLGLILGIGYLVKAPVLPVSVAFLASCLWAKAPWKIQAARVAVALLVLVAVASPFVIALSVQKARPTGWGSHPEHFRGISLIGREGLRAEPISSSAVARLTEGGCPRCRS